MRPRSQRRSSWFEYRDLGQHPGRGRGPVVAVPLHAWFHVWDRVWSPGYRVLAVVTGAALTTAVLMVATDVPLLVLTPTAILGWTALAVAEDHLDR